MDTTRPSSTRMTAMLDVRPFRGSRLRTSEAGRSPGRNRRGKERCRGQSGEDRPGEERHAGGEHVPEEPGEERSEEETEAAEQVVKTEHRAAGKIRNARSDERTLASLGEGGDEPVGGEQRPGVPGGARLREAGVARGVNDPAGRERGPAAQSIREPSQWPGGSRSHDRQQGPQERQARGADSQLLRAKQ